MKQTKKILLLRLLLILLILADMALIFFFSAQNGEESGRTSGEVTKVVAEVTVKDFAERPKAEQNRILNKLHPIMRKAAHMAEFGVLGALTFLLLLTWKGRVWWRFCASLTGSFVYACTDEWHQLLSEDRGARFSDVLIDTAGALIACAAVLGVFLLIRRRKERRLRSVQTTHYCIKSGREDLQLRLAVASDLHDCETERLLECLQKEAPDLILIPGDLTDDEGLRDPENRGYDFLSACARIAPTYYSLGNHEIACYHKGNPWRHPHPVPLTDEIRARIADTGAVLLENDCVTHGALCICGMTSGINEKRNAPDEEVLRRFSEQSGYRILLCHHPEYFVPYIEKTDIELTVCGHAHGGQWRLFGHGAYAPGQGIFPKYTAGVLKNRCVISRGLGNHTHIPRIFNRPELVIVSVEP